VIGAVLMAIGHFLMAFEPITAFYSALVFLILGNGMFKPNMSTQVGRLYPPGDPRRDGAYTIFYMGINLGAFVSPLLCGWLAENTTWSYHAGFTAAGIGMLLGLLTYLFGLPLVQELPQDGPTTTSPKEVGAAPAPAQASEGIKTISGVTAATSGIATTPPATPAINLPGESDRPMSEAQAERTPSVAPWLNSSAPLLLGVFAALLAVGGPVLAFFKLLGWDSAVGMVLAALGRWWRRGSARGFATPPAIECWRSCCWVSSSLSSGRSPSRPVIPSTSGPTRPPTAT
jgi:hypothetical protein